MNNQPDYIAHLAITGFCWKCGAVCFRKKFCNDKHQEQYIRAQDRQIRKSKKDGYGIAGSTH